VRWIIGVAAFLAPVVIVMVAMTQAPGPARTAVADSAAYLIENLAHGIGGAGAG
jgi:hypothetical protein